MIDWTDAKRPPRWPGRFLVADYNAPAVGYAYYEDGLWSGITSINEGWAHIREVTHWAPMPEPPGAPVEYKVGRCHESRAEYHVGGGGPDDLLHRPVRKPSRIEAEDDLTQE